MVWLTSCLASAEVGVSFDCCWVYVWGKDQLPRGAVTRQLAPTRVFLLGIGLDGRTRFFGESLQVSSLRRFHSVVASARSRCRSACPDDDLFVGRSFGQKDQLSRGVFTGQLAPTDSRCSCLDEKSLHVSFPGRWLFDWVRVLREGTVVSRSRSGSARSDEITL